MTNLYVIIKALLFPGAHLRCFWEQVICRICKIPVEDNRYLRDDETTSHIEHELVFTAGKAFAVCYIPYFMTSLSALFLSLIPLIVMFVFEVNNVILTVFSVLSWWYAISAYCNRFPLIENAINMKEQIYKNGSLAQKIIFAPGFAVLYVGAYMERYLITFVISVAVTVFLILF